MRRARFGLIAFVAVHIGTAVQADSLLAGPVGETAIAVRGDRGKISRLSIIPVGVDVMESEAGVSVSLPREHWQDPAKTALADRDFMALLPVDFSDGVIEVEVKGELAEGAPEFARAFAGLAFRVNEGRFESIYLRPTNGVADDQVRRNHSVQYVAFPEWRFDRLRRESPERYETAADIAPGRWTKMRVEVSGSRAVLFLDNRPSPVLIVNDLKHGAQQRGGIGLWVETGTIAHFRNLRVIHRKR